MFPADVATSTLTGLLSTIFDQTLAVLIYVLEYTWGYILAAAVIWFFYRIAKSAWHGR